MSSDPVGTGLIVFGAFVLLREVVCWYWKINEGVALLREIRDMMRGVVPNAVPPTAFGRLLKAIDGE